MKREDFDKLHFFNADENWGNIEQLQWWHVQHLELIRVFTEMPMVIHCSCERKGHSKKSYHPKGCATDFHFVTDLSLPEQYDFLKTTLDKTLGLWNFVGIGVYPEWNNPGFHLDGRGTALQWIRRHGNYYYGEDNLIQLLSSHEVNKGK